MTWNYAYSPSIWPSVFTVLLLIALAIYSGRRRSVPGATPFMVACLLAAGWAFCCFSRIIFTTWYGVAFQ